MDTTPRPGHGVAPSGAAARAAVRPRPARVLAIVVALGAMIGPLTACSGPEPAAGPEVAASPSPTTTPRPTPSPTLPQVPVQDAALGAQPVAVTPPPVAIVVPDVGIDMAIDPVGVKDDGEMEIPEDANRAGWYKFGPAPADPAGATVIAAHVDSVQTGVGQFARLLDVQVGATVSVTGADGVVHDYRVVNVEKLPKDGAPVDQWFDRSGAPRLVLVTCGGVFNREIGHYTDNVVVAAEPLGG